MTPSREKSLKDLYRPRDVIQCLVLAVFAIIGGVSFANFATSFAGI